LAFSLPVQLLVAVFLIAKDIAELEQQYACQQTDADKQPVSVQSMLVLQQAVSQRYSRKQPQR